MSAKKASASGGVTSYHLHSDKAPLILDVVKTWPAAQKWLTDGKGKPYESVRDAVQAICDVSTKYVPMGCPKPAADGRCPGHRKYKA